MAGPEVKRLIVETDGSVVEARAWRVGSPRARVLILHGYAEHSGRYEHVAAFLNERDYDVFAVDLRGHGRSDGDRGYVTRFGDYLGDLRALLLWSDTFGEELPLFMLGHSNGALIALQFFLHDHSPAWRGLIITSPFLGLAIDVPGWKRAMGRIMSVIYPRLALPSGLLPAHLSHDRTVRDAYAADPLVFKTATARFFTESERASAEVIARAAEIKIPCLILQAGEDHIADAKKSRLLHDRLGSEEKTYIEYPGMYHEIMNETERHKPLDEIARWLESRTRA